MIDFHDLFLEFAEAVELVAHGYLDAEGWYFGEGACVIRFHEYCLAEVGSYLPLVYVEGGHEFDVSYVVSSEAGVEESCNELFLFCVLVVLASLDEGG